MGLKLESVLHENGFMKTGHGNVFIKKLSHTRVLKLEAVQDECSLCIETIGRSNKEVIVEDYVVRCDEQLRCLITGSSRLGLFNPGKAYIALWLRDRMYKHLEDRFYIFQKFYVNN